MANLAAAAADEEFRNYTNNMRALNKGVRFEGDSFSENNVGRRY